MRTKISRHGSPPISTLGVMRDLASPVLIHLKGWLFLAILVFSIALLLFRLTSWETVLLLVLVVWSSARFYYYLFYVIENYVDAEYRFSGVLSALRYMAVKPPESKEEERNTLQAPRGRE